jgi:hypothetical protein
MTSWFRGAYLMSVARSACSFCVFLAFALIGVDVRPVQIMVV